MADLKELNTLLLGLLATAVAWLFKSLVRFPLTMMRARIQGALPEQLTLEQWINVALAFVVVGLLIVGFDKLRRDLRKIGI